MSLLRRIIGATLLSILTWNLCHGQEEYVLKTFTTRDGLPNNHVLDIEQDSTGFIWITTWDGLSRYDGYEFKNYYHHPGDSTSIPYFIVDKTIIDRRNNLFLQFSNKNLYIIFNRAQEKFRKVSQIKNYTSSDITSDCEGDIWYIDVKEGLHRWNSLHNRFEQIDLPGSVENIYRLDYITLCFDNLENLWIIYIKNPSRLKILIGKITNEKFTVLKSSTFKLPPEIDVSKNRVSNFQFRPVITASSDTLLFSNQGIYQVNFSVHKISSVSQTFSAKELPSREIFTWSSNNRIIYILNTQKSKENSFTVKPGQFVQKILVDNQKNTWVSLVTSEGQGEGVIQAIPVTPFFRHYLLGFDPDSHTNAYFAVLKDRFGNIWAAAKNRNFIYKITPGNQVLEVNRWDENIRKMAEHIRSIHEGPEGIWIGYFKRLLIYYDFSTDKFSVKFYHPEENANPFLIYGFENLTKNGENIICSSVRQVFQFNTQGKLNLQIRYQVENIDRSIYKIIKSPYKGYYVCMDHGTIKYLDEQSRIRNSWIIGDSLSNVEDICIGSRKDLWIALLGGGLVHLDPETGKQETFTTADGLSNNTCYAILKDRKGNLWISTNHGISRFNPETRKFRIFGASDGLKIDEFDSDAAYQTPDGEMFFGGVGGIVSFYPDSLKETENRQKPARLVITDLSVSGTTRYFEKAVYDSDTVSLHKGDNNFQVTFACLDFQNSDKIRYRYKLSGQDQDWTETDFRHRFVNYANLTPGEYPLEIEATDRNGDWISRTTLRVVIPSFFYQTLWFRGLMIILFMLTAGYIMYAHNNQVRLKARKKQEELKLESLRGQMNPHFIFNSLNSINYFISQNDRLSANRYIADFSRLIRSILGNLSSDYITLEKELESLNDYLRLEHLRFGKKFDYSVRLPENIETSEIFIFPGMVQPFIENAIWHGIRGLEGRKARLDITFDFLDSGRLQCLVEDDGIGRKLSEKRKNIFPGKTSRGIGIVTERLRIINNLKKTSYKIIMEDIYTDREETGTRVTIDIPVRGDP